MFLVCTGKIGSFFSCKYIYIGMAPLSPPVLTHLHCKPLQTELIRPEPEALKDGTQSLVMHHHKYPIITTMIDDQLGHLGTPEFPKLVEK